MIKYITFPAQKHQNFRHLELEIKQILLLKVIIRKRDRQIQQNILFIQILMQFQINEMFIHLE